LSGKEKMFAHWQGRQNEPFSDNKTALPDTAGNKKISLAAQMND